MRHKIGTLARLDGGLNVMSPETDLDPRQTPSCMNVEFRNGEVRSALGYQPYCADAVDAAPVGIGEYRQVDEDIFLVVHTPTKCYKYDATTQTYTDITGSVTLTGGSMALVSAVNFNNWYIFTNCASNTPKYWDGGAAIADLGGGAPRCRYLTIYKNRLIAAYTIEDGTTCPYRVRWSNAGDPEAWDANDYIDLVENENGFNGQITGISQVGNYLAVFRRNGVHLIGHYSGTFPSFNETVESGRGCIAPWSIQPVGNLVYYLSDDGIYAFDGRNSKNITEGSVKDLLTNLNTETYQYSYGIAVPSRSMYYVAVPCNSYAYTDTDRNNVVFGYDYARDVWTVRNFPVKVFGRLQEYTDVSIGDLAGTIGAQTGVIGDYSTEAGFMTLFSDYSTYVCYADYSNTFRGTYFTSYWYSAWVDLGDASAEKTVVRVEPFFQTNGSGDLTVALQADFTDTAVVSGTLSGAASGSETVVHPHLDCKVTGRWFRVKVTSAAGVPFRLQRVNIHFVGKGTK